METAYELSVPLRVDVEIGRNWLEIKQHDLSLPTPGPLP